MKVIERVLLKRLRGIVNLMKFHWALCLTEEQLMLCLS